MQLENLVLAGGQVTPQSGDLASGGVLELDVRVPNDGQADLRLSGTVRAGEQLLPFPEVEVRRSLFAIESGPLDFELAPGGRATRALGLRIDPYLATAPELKAPSWTGPGTGIVAELAGDSLRISVPADAVPGSYRGAVRVALPGGLQASLPCSLEVVAPRPRLALSTESCALEAAPGSSAETSVELVLHYRSGCTLELTCSDLVADGNARIGQRFDIELLPEQGWSGTELSPGSPQTLRLRVWTSSDLPEGLYKGTLQLLCRPEDGGEAAKREVPVVLEVQP